MSAAAEFFLIALAIYLWESGLWLPMRSVVLRKKVFTDRWNAVRPGHWMATRELGLVISPPLFPDTGLAVCQSPPLLVDEKGNLLIEIASSELIECGVKSWEQLEVESSRLIAGGAIARLSSPRALDLLRKSKADGQSPAEGVAELWRKTLSPKRAASEWRRWQLASAPLGALCLLLTSGFFIGLPVIYLYAGVLPMLGVVFFLWLVMWVIGSRLWWMAARVYPTVKNSLRADAALCVVVPFHAMRALEIVSAHAMANTHPAALLLSTGDTGNPWLAKFAREILHPRPEVRFDDARSSLIRPHLQTALARFGRTLTDFESPPSREEDRQATSYCPRCHSVFGPGAETCPDCRGVPLKPFV